MPLPLEEIIQRGQFTLTNIHAVIASSGHPMKDEYPEWVATSWTPRPERAYGNTRQEAVDALLELLQMK